MEGPTQGHGAQRERAQGGRERIKEGSLGEVVLEVGFRWPLARTEVKAKRTLWALQTKLPGPALGATSLLLSAHRPHPPAEGGKGEQGGPDPQHSGWEAHETLSRLGDPVPVLRSLCPPGSSWAKVAPHPYGCSFFTDSYTSPAWSPRTSSQGEVALPVL